MPSASLTDPIGPRSVDEMLGVVYGRADRLRRRRTAQRLGGGAAALALVLSAFVALGEGDDTAQLRVVDDPDAQQTTTTEPAPGDGDATTGGGNGGTLASGGDARAKTPPTTAPTASPPVTSLPAVNPGTTASLEAWKSVGDGEHDSVPEDWYYDVVAASMEFDREKGVVVFTTRYRSPDTATSSTRARRLLESAFDYGTYTYVVDVEEDDNRLGGVHIDGSDEACGSCTARFDVADATLLVTVPVAVLNAEVARHDDSPPLGSGSEIADLMARTAQIDEALGEVDADVTGQGRLR